MLLLFFILFYLFIYLFIYLFYFIFFFKNNKNKIRKIRYTDLTQSHIDAIGALYFLEEL